MDEIYYSKLRSCDKEKSDIELLRILSTYKQYTDDHNSIYHSIKLTENYAHGFDTNKSKFYRLKRACKRLNINCEFYKDCSSFTYLHIYPFQKYNDNNLKLS